MSIVKAFDIAFNKMKTRKWDWIYVVVDIHDTIIKGDYNNETFDYYPYAKEVLQILSKREDIVLILWSSSHSKQLKEYYSNFIKDNIDFDFINENPIELTNYLQDFSKKFYFNVGIDDKFGFIPEIEWKELYNYLIK